MLTSLFLIHKHPGATLPASPVLNETIEFPKHILNAREGSLFRSYTCRAFQMFFQRALDIEKQEQLEQLLTSLDSSLNLNEYREWIQSEAASSILRSIEVRAEKDKVFGVPFVIVNGEPFMGNDRIDWIRLRLFRLGLVREGRNPKPLLPASVHFSPSSL